MRTRFYEQRQLPTPDGELQPDSVDQLTESLDQLQSENRRWRLVGDGQHTRPHSDEGYRDGYVAIRTDGLDEILEFDPESGVVRAGAGVRWKQLEAALTDREWSLQRYGLHPSAATVGGLLARHRLTPPMLRGGDILDGCVAVTAYHPDTGDYRYLAAPRKASGPDLRHNFIGAEHTGGALLDATLVAWKPTAAKLVIYEDCSLTDAARITGGLFRASITPCWCHYGYAGRRLQLALAAPGRLLRARIQWLSDRLGEPDEIGDAEDVRARRHWLEARHPHRRNHPDAETTHRYIVPPGALTDDPTDLFGDGVTDVEIPAFTPRRADAFVRYESPEAAEQPAASSDDCWASQPLLTTPAGPSGRCTPLPVGARSR